MTSGVYKRTPQMKTGKYTRTAEHNRLNSLALKKAGIIPPSRLGVTLSEEHKKKISRFMKERKPRKGFAMHPNTKAALKKVWLGKHLTTEHRRKISIAQKGDKSHNWKGGLTPENKRIRVSIEMRLWHEAVFARDNWTCQECKIRGGKLEAHHIKRFRDFPELRLAIDNGITLCQSCHNKTKGGR